MLKETCYMVVTCMIYLTFNVNQAEGDKVCTPMTELRGPHPQGICGNRIDELLGLICVYGHNELHYSKRRKRDISDEQKKQLHNIVLKRQDANSYLMKRVSFERTGIVCECCYNQCTFVELFSYCKPGSSLFKRTVGKIITALPKKNKKYNVCVIEECHS